MYSLLISSGIAFLLFLSLALPGVASWGWSILWGILAFLAANGLIGFYLNKKIKALMSDIQRIMIQAQKSMQEKSQTWRFRPPGSIRQAQIEMQKMQHGFIVKALEHTKNFEKYLRWSPLLSKQIATMRMQLNYQDKNFKEVDALLPKCLIIDPMTSAMAMARTYMRDGYKVEKDKKGNSIPNKIDKYFTKATLRIRYGQGALLYGLYAWILNKEGDVDGAFKVLLNASKKMENDCINKNIELLKNNKPKHFSLSGLGDEWYALGLEEPKIKMQRNHERPY